MNKDRLKFRFFDKKTNQYIENTASMCIYEGKVCETLSDNLEEEKDIIAEQCTGLKDSNGKLIYEGDIVKFYEYNYEVYFNTNVGGFSIWNEKKEVGHSLYHHEEFKVIGNIHEDPELLEVK